MYGNYISLPHEAYSYFDTMCNLNNSTNGDLVELIKHIEEMTENEVKLGMLFSTFFPPTMRGEFKNTDKCLFTAMVYCKLGKFEEAYIWMKKHIEQDVEGIIENKAYFYCVRDYFKFISNGKSREEARNSLSHFYDKETVEEVIDDLKDSQSIFRYYNLPSCFDCNNCESSSNCRFRDIYNIFLNVKRKTNKEHH